MQFTWPPNDFTLMWLQIAVGFTGALTLAHFLRSLGRKFGTIPDLRVYFSPRGGCQDSLAQELQKSRKEILVQAQAQLTMQQLYRFLNTLESEKPYVVVEYLSVAANHALETGHLAAMDVRLRVSAAYHSVRSQ